MLEAERTALVLLAAGRSERFGRLDKLEQPFLREPIAFHVVTALEAVPFHRRFAVVSATRLDFAGRGYHVIRNDRPEEGQSRSLRLSMERVRLLPVDAVLIALADMPRVTAAHIHRLLDAARGTDAAVASSDGTVPRPPALFGRDHFPALMNVEGDSGARDLIRRGRHVVTSPAELVDIDTPEELEALRRRYAMRAG